MRSSLYLGACLHGEVERNIELRKMFSATNPTSNSVVQWNKTALRVERYSRRSRHSFY